MPRFSDSSRRELATCDWQLQIVCNEAIEIVDFTVIKGHRNQADQDKAFAEGKTKLKWPKGNHNATPSRAVDLAPVYYEKGAKIDWNDVVAFGRLMGVIQAIAHRHGIALRFGLDWDGDFRSVNRDPTESFFDAPHVELAALTQSPGTT